MTAALLVPVLVGFALEVPADAIDRIASPFIGQASAAVVTRKTEDDGLRRAVRTSMAPQLYPAGIVTAPRQAPSGRRGRADVVRPPGPPDPPARRMGERPHVGAPASRRAGSDDGRPPSPPRTAPG